MKDFIKVIITETKKITFLLVIKTIQALLLWMAIKSDSLSQENVVNQKIVHNLASEKGELIIT
jgi:hypothetical protein